MFLRRSLAHCFNFFGSVHLGVLPPPPPIPKSWLCYCNEMYQTTECSNLVQSGYKGKRQCIVTVYLKFDG